MLPAWTAYPPPSLPRSTISPASSPASGRAACSWPHRSVPRTPCCRAWPTPARASGIWPTPPGSLNASCWQDSPPHRRMTRPGTTCSTATTRASARRMRGRSVGCCRDPRCSRCATTGSRSMRRCNRGWRQEILMSRHCSTCSWACSMNSSTRNCCSPTSSMRSGAIRCSRSTARICTPSPALPLRRAGSNHPSASSPWACSLVAAHRVRL